MSDGAAPGPASTSTKLPELSALFPAFNERHNLQQMVDALRRVLPDVSVRHEIIIVDDGSSDGTGRLADELAAAHPDDVRVVHHMHNLGYGAAVRSGLSACRYGAVFFTDGDCQFDVGELRLLTPHLGPYDIVAGYRRRRQDPLLRRWYSRGWTWLIRCLTGVRVRDVNCAFKLFKREAIAGLPLSTTGAMINAELLALARRRGGTLTEVPVSHYPRVHGRQTGGDPRVILRAFWELLTFSLRRRR